MSATRSSRRHLLLLALLGLAIYLGTATFPGLFDDTDSIYPQIAREMLATGDWVTPRADGIRYFEKPPLLLWLTALSFKAFGVHDFTARLPGALAAVGGGLVAALVAELVFGAPAGLYGGLMMLTSAGYFIFTRQNRTDALFGLFLSLGFYFFLRGYLGGMRDAGCGMRGRGVGVRDSGVGIRESDFVGCRSPVAACRPASRLLFLAFYACMAGAVMTKGLIGVVFPVLTVLAFAGLTRDWGLLRRIELPLGMLVFLALAAPWHLAAGLRNPGFFHQYFIANHILRYLGEKHPVDYAAMPLWLFWGMHLAWLFPWSLLLPLAIARARADAAGPAGRGLLLLWTWAGAVLLFFSFSTRLEYYAMPAYPALFAWLGGALAAYLSQPSPSRAGRASAWLYGAVAMAGLVALVLVVWPGRPAQAGPAMSHSSDYPLYYQSPVADISSAGWRGPLRGPLEAAAALALMIGITGVLLAGRRRAAAMAGLAAAMVGLFICIQVAMARLEPYLSCRKLALDLKRVQRPGELVVAAGQYETKSTIVYYSGRQVHLLEGMTGYLHGGSRYPEARSLFLSQDALDQAWRSGRRTYLVVTLPPDRKVLASLPGPVYRLSEWGGKLLVSNRP